MLRRSLIAVLLVAPAPASAQEAAMPGWLAGCWEQIEGDRWTDECWTYPRGGIQLGSGRSGRGDALRSWESMQIVRGGDGKLSFWASPGGAPRVQFPLVSQGPREVVFANPAHDYPQRIRYWREGELLQAEVALADGSQAEGFTFRRDERSVRDVLGEHGQALGVDLGESALDPHVLGRRTRGLVNAQHPVADRGHHRRVPLEHAEVALGTRDIDLMDVLGADQPDGGDEFEVQRHQASSASFLAFATASSIPPTM